MRFALLLALLAGCYTQSRAARDLNPHWRGHSAAILQARLGAPRATVAQPDGTTVLRWTHRGQNIVALPSGSFDLKVTPTSFDVRAEARPGVVENVEYEIATAVVDPRGTVLSFDSGWLVAGIPPGHDTRTGVIFGLHGGMGRTGDASQPLPSVGTYIGGMLSPNLALVGAYAFVNGKDGDAYVQGHSWALAAQYWATRRVALRVGPAMVLHTDPVELAPGAVGALSFAVVRSGSFVLDLRFDATGSTKGAFGMLGVGVNVN